MRLLHPDTLLVVIPDVHTRHDRDPPEPLMPHILAEQRRLAHVALHVAPIATLASVHGPELNLLLHDGLGCERRRAVPARKDLERLLGLPPLLADRVVPEQVLAELPAAALWDLEELVPIKGAADPDIVEGRTTVDPVHGARHVGLLQDTLVDELEDVFHAEGDVIDKEDRCVWVKVLWGGGKRVESLVAEDCEGFHTVDARAGFGVDVVGGEVVGGVKNSESGRQGVENLVGAVVGSAFNDGEGAIRWTEEADSFDDGAEEAGEERGAGIEVEREEVFWF